MLAFCSYNSFSWVLLRETCALETSTRGQGVLSLEVGDRFQMSSAELIHVVCLAFVERV